MNSLQLVTLGALTVADIDRRRRTKARSLAPATQAGYARDLRVFERWCIAQGRQAAPATPETVGDYLDASPSKVSTLRRHVAAISAWHNQEGHPDPCADELVRGTLKGIARERGTEQRQAAGLTREDARLIAFTTGNRLKDLRDLALMRVGRDLLARAGELVSLTVEMVTWTEDGAQVALRRFKTATQAEAYLIGSEATVALHAWLEAAGITEGPVWRSLTKGGRLKPTALCVRDVGRVLRGLGNRIGASFSSHSMRVGMAQDLVAANVGEGMIVQAGGWASSQMVTRYARRLNASRGAIAQYYARRK